ncbi:MAG: hypothetical protein U5N10_17455 [Gemmobacter sp.]|nr:hypothetical protein [Gemmobacter sp.]
MLTDPWEGLGPVWYWTTRNLNAPTTLHAALPVRLVLTFKEL